MRSHLMSVCGGGPVHRPSPPACWLEPFITHFSSERQGMKTNKKVRRPGEGRSLHTRVLVGLSLLYLLFLGWGLVHPPFLPQQDPTRLPESLHDTAEGEGSMRPVYRVRDPAKLIEYCGGLTSAQCLRYLAHSKADYLVPSSMACRRVSPDRLFLEGEEEEGDVLYFHTFWRGPMTEKPALAIKSYLYSQNQECTHLVVWLDEVPSCDGKAADASIAITDGHGGQRTTCDRLLMEIHQLHAGRVTLRVLNMKAELTELSHFLHARYDRYFLGAESAEEMAEKVHDHIRSSKPTAFSDAVRFVVLTLYGGVYFDADVLLLRDLLPFAISGEFAYRWSMESHFNTAVMRLFRRGLTAAELHRVALAEGPADYHPNHLHLWLEKILDVVLYRYPSAFFDPVWLVNDMHEAPPEEWRIRRFNDAFLDVHEGQPARQVLMHFEGALAYHWHNRWGVPWKPNSYLQRWNALTDEWLAGSTTNLYGEPYKS